MLEHINKHFPHLTEKQKKQFELLMSLYPEWNEKINVISRKDISNLEINHILHSLAIGKFIKFTPGSEIMDIGSGGGLPAIPLAILFPDVKFHLIDRIGKKMRVADEIAKAAELRNISTQHGDVGECHKIFDFVINRGVMPQNDLLKLVRKNISPQQKNALPNGLISLKGGDLREELKTIEKKSEVVNISNYFDEPFFETKKIVYTLV